VKPIALIAKTCRIISVAILFCIGAAALGLFIANSAGFKPLGILGGSMRPAYKAGTLIFVNTNIPPEKVKVGDVITYQADSKTRITHRVYSLDREKHTFITKGDANDDPDNSPITYSMYVGVAGFPIPAMGYLLMNLTERKLTGSGLILTGFLAASHLLYVLSVSQENENEQS
jgi:signal peptidase